MVGICSKCKIEQKLQLPEHMMEQCFSKLQDNSIGTLQGMGWHSVTGTKLICPHCFQLDPPKKEPLRDNRHKTKGVVV